MTLRKRLSETIKSIKMLKQQSGSVLIISALMLPLMLGCLGFAYDFGNLYMHKSRLQNMTDAAALAGGYAFLESRKKPEKRDTIDDSEVALMGRAEVTYIKDVPVNARGGKHPDADKAADDYIKKNIENLGTTVTSDRFSHYALKSKGAMSTSTELSGDISHIGHPRTFYRIGLYEDVPLYFLSVLIGRDKQRVRAGTVVLVDDGKGYAVGKSLFDNLFTVGEEGITVKDGVVYDSNNNKDLTPSENGAAVIQATFDGDIVIAVKQEDWNSTKTGDDFYSEEEKSFQSDDGQGHSINDMNTNYPNMGGKAVRDNSLGIDSSVAGFLSKLERQHFDLKRNVLKDNTKYSTIVAKNLNNKLQSEVNYLSNHYTITTTTPATPTTPEKTDIQYYHDPDKKGNKLVFCVPRSDVDPYCRGKVYERVKDTTDLYYSLLSEGYKFKYYNDKSALTETTCFTYVYDDKQNQIFCAYNSGKDTWTFYRKDVTINADSTREVKYWQLYADSKTNHHDLEELPEENGSRRWSYKYPTVNDLEYTFTIKKETIEGEQSRRVQVNEPQITNSNVFHWESDGWKSNADTIPLTLEVSELAGGDYYPLYIILTGNEGTPININVTKSNERPVIFCNLTTNEINFKIVNPNENEVVSFKGMIYSPFAKVVNAPLASESTGGGKFIGNIVAKGLDIKDGSINWTHHNFLANDSDLNTVSDDVALAQEQRKERAETNAREYVNKYLTSEDQISEEDWNNPDWFSRLTDNTLKAAVKTAWSKARKDLLKDLGLDMPDWPWKDGGKPTDLNNHHYSISENESDFVGEKVRIINFRTEYRTDPYIDPFTDLELFDD